MDNLKKQKFNEINFSDPFFNSLKMDYSHGFVDWWHKKCNSNEEAFVLYNNDDIEGFLYLKSEFDPDDVVPPLQGHFLKVGTFKFNSAGTLRGERFIKKIIDTFINLNLDGIYVTIFEKHDYLIKLFKRYGFNPYGTKASANGTEVVLIKSPLFTGSIEQDYPYLNTKVDKFLLAIHPKYHTQLFPDSILKTESTSIVQDISHSNSIHKIYISKIHDLYKIKQGDLIVFYRTTEEGKFAEYSAVATSICTVEDICTVSSFKNEDDYLNYCSKFSVYNETELREIYKNSSWRTEKPYYIIKFLYNIALPKRVIRKSLIENVGIDRSAYWGFIPLSEQQFKQIFKLGNVNESFIID